jgi:signal transduction histidine kinase
MLEATNQTDPEALRAALRQVAGTLNLLGTDRLDDILGGIFESLPSLAKELDKNPPKVLIQDHGLVFRTQVSPLLKNLFTHLFRNAIDHGIETPEVRLAQGKSPEGHIRLDLSMSLDGTTAIMTMRDDGRGLALARIRETAYEKKLLSEEEVHTPEAIAQLIFVSGFSTAERVSEISGRGVGMDAVKGFLEREGGTIQIRFLDDNPEADFRPFETIITLPEKWVTRAQS